MIVVADPPMPRNGRQRPGTRIAALERVANRPIVHHVLESLTFAGADEVVVAAPSELVGTVRESLAGAAAHRGVLIRYVDRCGPLAFHEALELAAPIIGSDPCVAHLASGLLDEPLARFADHLRDDATDVVLLAHDPAANDRPLNLAARSVHPSDVEAKRAALDSAGVLLLGRGALTRLDPTDLVPGSAIAAIDCGFRVRFVDGWQSYAGDASDLLELNRIALDRLVPGTRKAVNNGNRIEGRVVIDRTASVQSSVILGPAVIGPGARIVDAYIGPYTSIGDDVRIEGVEIERSIIFSGASVMHIGSRLVASLVGENARVFRDFSLPRAIRLRVGQGDEVALC
jgi:glucose-1-phosphate thymidylyltransferase